MSAGIKYPDDLLRPAAVVPTRPPHETRLTERERLVFQELMHGQTCDEIAVKLGRSTKTIQSQRALVLLKLGLANKFELGVYAERHGLVSAKAPR
jgi:DNA-binding NarL/FixJ family response regulator